MSVPPVSAPAEADERQPLLTPELNPGRVDAIPDDFDGSLGQSEAILQPKKTRSKLQIALYILLVLLSALVLAVFIKGWIDSEDVDFELGAALKSALGGGLSGAAAMVLQVLLLMPIRTVMNFQYRFGMSTTLATKTLYADGGMGRYYQGLGAALIQGPVSRFGDTAANAGILALLKSNTFMNKLPAFLKTVFASLAAAAFRMTLTPVDTLKTTLQAQGRPGWDILKRRIKQHGITTLWYGAFATAGATFVGHYPWFATYNTLDERLPPSHTIMQQLARSAFIGFVASVISDTVSNSLRVVKTYRQVDEERVGYLEAARRVVAQDGYIGLFGRGLKTRIIANGLQGIMFSILWKLFLDL
ncbi:mitochondrial carrier [Ramaria rubella]|nr:mitochondrial carrier [Ramaria rubella]